ncbi:MAG: hypothetical protein M1820_008566 [Bogoriella megaspora]|nr:MAG: hypothetical protein M1820_008566 [Bogoriella megaspora]
MATTMIRRVPNRFQRAAPPAKPGYVPVIALFDSEARQQFAEDVRGDGSFWGHLVPNAVAIDSVVEVGQGCTMTPAVKVKGANGSVRNFRKWMYLSVRTATGGLPHNIPSASINLTGRGEISTLLRCSEPGHQHTVRYWLQHHIFKERLHPFGDRYDTRQQIGRNTRPNGMAQYWVKGAGSSPSRNVWYEIDTFSGAKELVESVKRDLSMEQSLQPTASSPAGSDALWVGASGGADAYH